MAKPTRLDHGDRMLHVIGRAVHDDSLFPSDDYARVFWDEVGRRSLEFGVDVLAMCLLGNHYHLIARGQPESLSATMHRALSRLANTRNHLDERRLGALVGRRYNVVGVRDERHKANLIRYVPMNPVRHGLARDPSKWVWSTHSILLGKRVAPDWFDRSKVLDAFGFEGPEEYERFVLSGAPLQRPPMTEREVRLHRVLVLADAGLTSREIAITTGFSESYVRRIVKAGSLDRLRS